MSDASHKRRQPAAFRLDDPKVIVSDADEMAARDQVQVRPESDRSLLPAPIEVRPPRAKGFPWGAVFWSALSGLEVAGYEIRHGATGGELAFASGRFLGVYLHGLFEQPAFVRALLGAAPPRSLDDELDRLADAVAAHIDVDRLMEGLL